MTKILKKLTLAVISLCILITGVFAAACAGGEDPSKDGYIITVLYPNGTPVKSLDTGTSRRRVRVTLTDDEGKNLLSDYESKELGILNDDGVSALDYKIPGEYNITVYNVPDGYYAPEIKTSKNKSKYTVTLINKVVQYDVSVKFPDGSAANNLDVKLMDGDTQVYAGKTNAEGKLTTDEIYAGIYDVVVPSPEGKIYNHKPVTTLRNGNPVEVKLFETTVITTDESHKMTKEQYDYWAERVNGPALTRISENNENYLFSADVYGTDETYFLLHAEKKGLYTMTLKSEEDENGNPLLNAEDQSYGNYIVKYYVNGNYGQENTGMRLDGKENGGNLSQHLSMNEGDDFIFSISSKDGAEHYSVQFILAYSKEASKTNASSEGTYTLTYNEIDEAVIEFNPSKPGKYKITSLDDDNDPRLVYYSNGTNRPVYDEDGNLIGDDNSGEGKNFEYIENIGANYYEGTFIYHIFIDKPTTTSVRVKIERIGDADEGPKIVTDEVKVGATLVKQSKQEGSWHWLAENDTVTEKDGEYFVTVDGTERKVYVAITKNIYESIETSYSFKTIEYLGPDEVRPADSPSDSQPDNGKKNNRLTVCEIGDTTHKYNYSAFIDEYAEYCDETDGVYLMNAELKLFVERFMNQQWTNFVDPPDPTNPPSNMLQFACGYFA